MKIKTAAPQQTDELGKTTLLHISQPSSPQSRPERQRKPHVRYVRRRGRKETEGCMGIGETSGLHKVLLKVIIGIASAERVTHIPTFLAEGMGEKFSFDVKNFGFCLV